jgi:hypothetical protein
LHISTLTLTGPSFTTKKTMHTKVAQAKQRLQHGSETVQDKTDQATRKVSKLTRQVRGKLPIPPAGRFKRLKGTLRRPRPIPAVAVALSAALVLGWLRNKNK